jgi:hypothetical protein
MTGLNNHIRISFRVSKKFKIIFGLIVGLFLVVCFTIALLFGERSVAINTSQKITYREVNLSIGSLEGKYDVIDFTIYQQGTVSIPYEAQVDEGKYNIYVKNDDNKIIWKDEVTSAKKGEIELQGKKWSVYTISIHTKSAKNIKFNIHGSKSINFRKPTLQ